MNYNMLQTGIPFSGVSGVAVPGIPSYWDSPVEQSSHNFVEYSQAQDDYAAAASVSTPHKFFGLPTPTADSASSVGSVGSVAMRRSVSRSSAGSYHSQRPSQSLSHKQTRPRIHTPVSASNAPTYGIYQDGTANDLQSYFSAQSQQYIPSTYYNMQQPFSHIQHIDPACTQMGLDFDTSAAPSVSSVSSVSWNTSANNSRHSSPDAADKREPSEHSDSSSEHSSDSTDFVKRSPSTSSVSSSVTESSDTARDHYLYKNVTCGPDGLYHCPWEGKTQCSHKPEKLKCNYDKFVDSHLKPYRCKHASCENARFSSTACLLRHEREAHAMHGHGDKPYLCPYPGCDRAQPGFGFPRQWNLKDHMRRVHRDDGHAAAVPVSVNVYDVNKNRKRKKEAGIVPSSTTARKTASSRAAIAEAQAAQAAAAAAAAQAQAQAQAAAQAEAYAAQEAYAAAEAEKARLQMEQWTQYRTSLLDCITNGLESPNDPEIQTQLQLIQDHVDHLNQIAAACFLTQETAPYMHFSQG